MEGINKSNRHSIRLKSFDYTSENIFFVTICSSNQEEIFGKVDNGSISLTALGIVIDRRWQRIVHDFENVALLNYVIMPNHLHGLIHLNYRATTRVAPTLGQVIGSFKSKCVKDWLCYIKERDIAWYGKIWQRNYFEHIVRNSTSYDRINDYIEDNQRMWCQNKLEIIFRNNSGRPQGSPLQN